MPDEQRRALAEERTRYTAVDFDPDYDGRVDGSIAALQGIRSGTLPVSPRDVEHLVALYDRGVAYVDGWIGRLTEELARRGLLDRTLLLVTADHGEELFEHQGSEHGRTFYEEVMRVPLILRVPGLGRGRTIAEQVAHVDVLPTVLDLLGVRSTLFVQGRSLRPLVAGDALPERPVLGEAAQTPGLYAIRTSRWKYVSDPFGKQALYDLVADAGERTNLCAAKPALCAPFAAALEAWKAENAGARARLALPAPAPAAVDAATDEKLRALGYID
jgi:arylsulfatase A-like enzyme